MRGLFVTIAAVFVLSLCAPRAGAQEPPPDQPDKPEAPAERESPVDAVFLVDSSASIWRTDPEKARQVLIEAFSGFLWARPGDRVAVAQFAGWEETKKNVAVPLPLAEIPSDYAGRKALLEDMRQKLGGMKPFGTATDMNAALEIALPEVEKDRGDAEGKPLWAIVITDGGFDVVEGDNAREEYITKAEGGDEPVGPDTLAKAASDMFFADTLPALSKRGVVISFIALGCGADDLTDFFKKAAETVECRVLCTRDLQVRDIFVDLLRSCPARDNSDIPSYGFSKASAEAGGEVLVPLRVLPGTSRTRAVLFATSSEFDVSIATPDGVAIDEPKLTALGDGTPYRVAWIDEARPGEYALKIANKGDEKLDVEFAIFGEVALELKLEWPEDSQAHLMGAPAEVTASLADKEGTLIADQPTLLETFLELKAADGAGNATDGVAKFEKAEDGKLEASVTTEGLAAGPATVTVKLHAYPLELEAGEGEEAPQVTYIYESPEQSHVFNLLPGVMVQFASPQAFVKQDVKLVAKCSANVVNPPVSFSVSLEPEATVAFAKVADGYEGMTSFDVPGRWKILKGEDPQVLFAPGKISEVEVVGRTMRILSAEPPNARLDEVTYPVKFLEATGTGDGQTPPYQIPVIIEMSAVEGETILPGEITLSPSEAFTKKDLSGDVVSFSFAAAPEVVTPNRIKAMLTLAVNGDDWLPEELGVIEAKASVKGVESSGRIKVKLKFTDFWEKLFWKYMHIWAPIAGAILLLLLCLLWILLRARFKYHQLRPVATLGKQEFLLRGMGENAGSRDAYGTPDVKNAVHFRIRGHRPFTRGKVRVERLMPEAAVQINGQDVPDGWARLRHGDEIVISAGTGMKVAYWYFDREPTPEELEEKVKGFFVTLGDDEFVIMGLD